MNQELFELTPAKPESLGIPSGAIDEFLSELKQKRFCMHSFILLRHGKIAAEGYWPPFEESRKQRIYSISKSFTAIAVGMMIKEGKLSLESKVSDYFPEILPESLHSFTLEATVRDLLMMSTCNDQYPYESRLCCYSDDFISNDGNKHKPGQVFLYDTPGTTALCTIIEKLSGMTMLEYMKPVLDEIGFSKDVYCIKTPDGHSWTGSGIICTSRDLVRVALLCMNKGEWNGKQLLDRDFITAATSKQIDTSISSFGIECGYGYGYQIWCLRDAGFFFYGMGSQFALCLPELDMILITTADTQGSESAGDLIIDTFFRLVDKVSPIALPDDKIAYGKLCESIKNLSFPLPRGDETTLITQNISGRTFKLDKNTAGMKWLRLIVESDKCKLEYENETGTHEFVFGMKAFEPFLFPELNFGKQIGIKDTYYKCVGAGAWVSGHTFLGTIYSIDDYMGSIKMQLTFSEDEVTGLMVKAAEWFFDEYQGFISGKAEELF